MISREHFDSDGFIAESSDEAHEEFKYDMTCHLNEQQKNLGEELEKD